MFGEALGRAARYSSIVNEGFRVTVREGKEIDVVLESVGVPRRLDLAKRDLADRDLSITKIAWLLGYQEASAFTNAFKRWTGMTPRAARQGLEGRSMGSAAV